MLRLRRMALLLLVLMAGCTVGPSDTSQKEITNSANQEKAVNAANQEAGTKENLFTLNQKKWHPETDVSSVIVLTDQYVDRLQDYLKSNTNLTDIEGHMGVEVIEDAQNQFTVQLIRYDANPIGFGTLERTWTFLQVVSEKGINVYTIFKKSAEYPLYVKTVKLSDQNQMIAIAGLTNVSRSNTAFISFWENSADGLDAYDDIDWETDYENDSMTQDNEYYIEYFGDEDVHILNLAKQNSFFGIEAKTFRVNSMLQGKTVIIQTSKI